MPVELSVDMRQIGLELKLVDAKFAAALKREIRAAVTELGFAHVERVKSAALSQKLRKAADAVYMRPNFSLNSAGVRIVVGRGKAPYARPMEIGNRGGSEADTTFLNGTKGVVEKRPFFFNTMRGMEPADEAAFIKAIDIVCREAGFR